MIQPSCKYFIRHILHLIQSVAYGIWNKANDEKSRLALDSARLLKDERGILKTNELRNHDDISRAITQIR